MAMVAGTIVQAILHPLYRCSCKRQYAPKSGLASMAAPFHGS